MNAGEFGSEEAAAMGGKARAQALSPEQRRAIAQKAAMSRWSGPEATHEGVMAIGEIEIPCFVLNDQTRLISQQGFLRAIGRARTAKGGQGSTNRGVDEAPPFLAAINLKPYISRMLHQTTIPIPFKMKSGWRAFGYRAELLADVCELFLAARREGNLHKSQEHIAERCEILMGGFARIGIIALVDEATGYQYDRPRRDLEEYLKTYMSETLRRWVRTFPADYFKHLCRLRNVELRADMRLPQYFGHLTNNLIYRRIAPGLLRSLKERRLARGSQSNKLHSWCSEDTGIPEVLLHMGTVVGFMKAHTLYEPFEKQLDLVVPMYPEVPGLFDDPKDWETPK